MRVLIKRSINPSVNHIFNGIARVLVKSGLDPVSWDGRIKPSFDAFDEIRPDLFLCSDYDITHSDLRCLNEYRQSIFVLHKRFDPTILSEHNYEAYGAKPDLIFQNVRKELTPHLSLPCALDILDNFKPDNKAKFAISTMISEPTKYESFIKPLLGVAEGVNLSVFSEHDLGSNAYYGPYDGNEHTIYAKSYLNIIFGNSRYESNHRLYDCIKYNGMPIVEFNDTDHVVFKSTFQMFQNVDDIRECLKTYSAYPKQVQNALAIITQEGLRANTYFHRAADLFTHLGLSEIVDKIENSL